MENQVQTIDLNKLIPHPDNPNEQSKTNFNKLIRNIKRSGRYEPLIVRPHPHKKGFFQIINGHHRCKALAELGYEKADALIWDVDDRQTDILLATLNRLGGSDELSKKLVLLKRLSEKLTAKELGRLLPQKQSQIQQLVNLKLPAKPVPAGSCFLNPLVFFVTASQKQIIENALLSAEDKNGKPKAVKRAAALTKIALSFPQKRESSTGYLPSQV